MHHKNSNEYIRALIIKEEQEEQIIRDVKDIMHINPRERIRMKNFKGIYR